MSKVFTRVDRASEMTGLSRSALSRLVKKGKLKADTIGGRQFFNTESLNRFITERQEHRGTDERDSTLCAA